MKDIGNYNWWGRQVSIRGWMIQVRIRRKGRRKTYRKWFTLKVFNYNSMGEPEKGLTNQYK